MTIVTGGAGFIGSHLVELLVARGERVCVVEKPGVATSHLPPSVEIIFADIRDAQATRSAMTGGTVVYHLAANPNLWARGPAEFDEVNHRGTVHVLDAAIAAGARRIVHCSTESILTCKNHHGVISEQVRVTESDAVGPYCLSKLRAEVAARARAEAGHPVLIANPTMPVGPGDRGLSPPTRLILDFCKGKLFATIEARFNLVDVRDVAHGLMRVAEVGTPGPRYLLGGQNLSLIEMLKLLSPHVGVPVPRWKIPYPLALGYAKISEMIAGFVPGYVPRATTTGVRLTRRSMEFDCTQSRTLLGLTPRPVPAALLDAVAWLVSTGQLELRSRNQSKVNNKNSEKT